MTFFACEDHSELKFVIIGCLKQTEASTNRKGIFLVDYFDKLIFAVII